MRKVLEVFGEPISTGGQESFVMTALHNMDLSSICVDLFSPYYCDNKDCIAYINSIGGKVFYADLPFKVGGARREIVPCFDEYLDNNHYDVVHIHSGSISVLALYAKVASRHGIKKIIVHSHSTGYKENIKHFLIKHYAASFFLKYATDFCACSEEAARWKFPKSVLRHTKILKNGVDLEKYQFSENDRNRLRNQYGIKKDEFVLGHVGRFTYEKNQSFLIDVLKEYSQKKGEATLVLVGDGKELQNVKAKADNLDLVRKIVFTGTQSNIGEYLSMFDVFVFPSLYEGLGIVGIEAQAAGLPVIASDRIPQAMKVSNGVKFVSLTNIPEWIDAIESYKNVGRFDNDDSIKKAGFDIKESAKAVWKMYIND